MFSIVKKFCNKFLTIDLNNNTLIQNICCFNYSYVLTLK